MKYLLMNTVSIISIICAALLMWYGKDGWGWFIFLALGFGHSWSTSDTKNSDDL